jgi:hypothetical protein
VTVVVTLWVVTRLLPATATGAKTSPEHETTDEKPLRIALEGGGMTEESVRRHHGEPDPSGHGGEPDRGPWAEWEENCRAAEN